MLHYQAIQHHSSERWVTFIHGAGGSISTWYKQIRAFQKDYNVLLIDLRGHGRSNTIQLRQLKQYTFQSIGDDIIEVLDHLEIECSHFIGISLGAIIIRSLAERFPNRVQNLIMGGAVMNLNMQGRLLLWLGNRLKSIVPYMILYRIFAWIILPRANHRVSRMHFIEQARKMYHAEFKRWFGLTLQINPLLKLFRSKELPIRTLYIMGEQDYMFLPAVSQLVENHSHSQLAIIPGCGHVVNLEQPTIFNQMALNFLNQDRSVPNNFV